DPNNEGSFVPGLSITPVDLSYGYFDARGLLRNTTSLRIGRQISFNELGFWSYDGAEVAFAPDGLFELSSYVGYEQRGGVPFLSTSRYEADGVYRGDRSGMSGNSWPSFLSSTEPAPAYGASLALRAWPELRARADYRRVNQHDTVVTVPFADSDGSLKTFAGSRLSSERLGAALGLDIGRVGSVDGAWVYDLYRHVSQEHRLYATLRVSSRLRITAGYLYRLPVFDADSIFNWFGAKGSILTQTSATWRASDRLNVTLSGGARWLGLGPRQWLSDALGAGPEVGLDWILRLDSVYVSPDQSFGAGTNVESGDAGDRLSTDVWYRQSYWDRRLESRLQIGAGHWQHPLMAERSQSSLIYVAGVRLHPGGKPELGLEWEHILLEHAAHRFRMLATLSARWP
ncbi:MAG TPA: hypothetical protein VIV60_33175, partial [Polyangiaceae bacterium]